VGAAHEHDRGTLEAFVLIQIGNEARVSLFDRVFFTRTGSTSLETLWILTRFLHANRCPPRLKTLIDYLPMTPHGDLRGRPRSSSSACICAAARREPYRDNFSRRSANTAGLALVDSWPDWPNRTILLAGPEGSGEPPRRDLGEEAGARSTTRVR